MNLILELIKFLNGLAVYCLKSHNSDNQHLDSFPFYYYILWFWAVEILSCRDFDLQGFWVNLIVLDKTTWFDEKCSNVSVRFWNFDLFSSTIYILFVECITVGRGVYVVPSSSDVNSKEVRAKHVFFVNVKRKRLTFNSRGVFSRKDNDIFSHNRQKNMLVTAMRICFWLITDNIFLVYFFNSDVIDF